MPRVALSTPQYRDGLSSVWTCYRNGERDEGAKKNCHEKRGPEQISLDFHYHNRDISSFVIFHIIFWYVWSTVSSDRRCKLTPLLGMNTSDIREMDGGQRLFWSITGPISIFIIAISCFLAFHGRRVETFPRVHLHSQKTLASTIEGASLE